MNHLNVHQMLPFLSNRDLNELADRILEADPEVTGVLSIEYLLPYLKSRKVDEIFLKRLRAHEDVSAFYPHVSDAALHQLVQAYLHEEIDIDISELYPFLPSADIKELLMIALKQTEEKDDETGSTL